MKALDKATRDGMTPKEVLEALRKGNTRYYSNKRIMRDALNMVQQTAKGQFPMACILGCVDSRVIPERLFDVAIGDVFTARTAGNVVNEDVLGSMEFACKVAGAKLILVMGHTACGAVKGACDNVELGNLTGLLGKIKPAVDSTEESGDRSSSNAEFVDRVALNHVNRMINEIRLKSPVLQEMESLGEISIDGAMYDIKNGVVHFMGDEQPDSVV